MTLQNQLNLSTFLHFITGLERWWLWINVNSKKNLANPLCRLLTAIKINKCISLSHTDTFISNTNQSVELSLIYCSWAQREVRSPRPSGRCGRAGHSSRPRARQRHAKRALPCRPSNAAFLPWTRHENPGTSEVVALTSFTPFQWDFPSSTL